MKVSLPIKTTFRTQSTLLGWVAYNYVKLLRPFDPTNSGNEKLETGSEHEWKAFGMEYVSKPQQLFTYGATFRYGGYYAGGTRFNVTTDLGYRFPTLC